MPKLGLASLVAAVVTLSSSLVSAEDGRTLTTTWYFRATYPSGTYGDSTNASASGPILMYTGAQWRCERVAASINKAGDIIAGYSCFHLAGGFMNVFAGCSPTREDSDANQVGIGDANGNLVLSVRCSTRASAPAPAKSVDKNL